MRVVRGRYRELEGLVGAEMVQGTIVGLAVKNWADLKYFSWIWSLNELCMETYEPHLP